MKQWLIGLVFTLTALGVSADMLSQGGVKPQSVTINDPYLKACNNSAKPLTIEPNSPLVVIVHGCFSSAAKFKALADVYQHLGQQTACFEYDDRHSLERVSGDLTQSLNKLSSVVGDNVMTVIAHSQGGLISRRALTQDRDDSKIATHSDLELVTVSTPFNGIQASSHCGIHWLRGLSLGVVDGICYLVTGSKYRQIPPQTDFINTPGQLVPNLSRHLIVKTDERDSCRTMDAIGRCVKDDYVFSVAEQTQLDIEWSEQSEIVTVRAGHAEIVGNETDVPWKLIETLQLFDVMKKIDEKETNHFFAAVEKIYKQYE